MIVKPEPSEEKPEPKRIVRQIQQHRHLTHEESVTRLRESKGEPPLSQDMNPFFLRLRDWSISSRARGKEPVWVKDNLRLKESEAMRFEIELMKKGK